MVSVTHAYSHFDDDTYDRYRGRGQGYPLSHDRELSDPGQGVYAPARNIHLGVHDNRIGDQGSDNGDINSRPRSRIPVACGRCRKRKIRCSGDQGGQCLNCKNAGNEQCQFLRVSSTEAALKSDSAGYDYDPSAGSRLNCRMIPYGPHSFGMGVEVYPYRHNSLSAFQFPHNSAKPYCPLPQYGEFAEDYDVNASPYPLLPNDPLANPSYTTSSAGRGWNTPTPQIPKTSLYLEQQDLAFNQGQFSYHGGAFPLRPAISPEPKSISMHGLTTSLPTPTTVNDRLLPVPAANRQSGSFMRAADGLLAVSQPNYPAYDGFMSASVLASLKNHSNSSGHSSSYIPSISSSSSESQNSILSQISYSSGPILNSQPHQMYPPANNENSYSPEDSAESSYIPGSPTLKQDSQCHTQNSDGSHGSRTSLPDRNLANGHPYHVPSQPPIYPHPPIEKANTTTNRHHSTGISAA